MTSNVVLVVSVCRFEGLTDCQFNRINILGFRDTCYYANANGHSKGLSWIGSRTRVQSLFKFACMKTCLESKAEAYFLVYILYKQMLFYSRSAII